jgi:hypothetical protein
MFLLFL